MIRPMSVAIPAIKDTARYVSAASSAVGVSSFATSGYDESDMISKKTNAVGISAERKIPIVDRYVITEKRLYLPVLAWFGKYSQENTDEHAHNTVVTTI